MSKKRIVLANDSRLLREMLQRVMNKVDDLEVVQELPGHEELPSAIEQLDPECVILSVPDNRKEQNWINTCMAGHPSTRFVFLSRESSTIKLKWPTGHEEDLTNLSVRGFIDILERDPQHT
jgi:DNA-binding NarL/FixJ family response regulator